MSGTLLLTDAQLDSVITHARAHKPEEACGILAGKADDEGVLRVERVFLMENAEHSSTFYMMDSREQFKVFDEMEKNGLQPVAIFHSHPHSPAFPSGIDLELAFYPDSLYVIVSLMDDSPDCRAFRINHGAVIEAEVKIVPAAGQAN